MFDDTDGLADPLTGARVTMMGRFKPSNDPEVRRRYLARHPSAELYVDFGDFSFWTLRAETAHAVAGFGRIETLSADEVLLNAVLCAELSGSAAGAIQHMNEDHAEAVGLYATKLLGQEPGDWQMVSIDRDGADLANSERSVRLAFENPVTSADDARAELVQLAKQAGA